MAMKIFKSIEVTKRPQVKIDAQAFVKMLMYTAKCSTEVAWYGFVSRDKDTYTIEDVFLFPQSVTEATVSVEEEKLALWHDENIGKDPDKVDKFRFHGHSHPNSNVKLSKVDVDYRLQTTSEYQPETQEYHLFMIINKSGEISLQLFDFFDMIAYSTDDIDISVTGGSDGNELTLAMICDEIDQFVEVRTPGISTIDELLKDDITGESCLECKYLDRPIKCKHMLISKGFPECLKEEGLE
ncbi:MAG: hypothetical protein FWH32_06800 [Clostridiales bacterium]|nr:hypothetical protein [Clostridiales bacterium]